MIILRRKTKKHKKKKRFHNFSASDLVTIGDLCPRKDNRKNQLWKFF